MAKQQDQIPTMRWIDLSTYKARISLSENDGRRFLVVLGVPADGNLGRKLQEELGFELSSDGDWLIRDDLKLSLTMLRTVLPAATVKIMQVDQVTIPLDDVESVHEALVGGRRRAASNTVARAKGATFVVPRTGRGSLTQDPHRIPDLVKEFCGLPSEKKGQLISKLYSEGNTYREIADALSLSHQEVRLLSLAWKKEADSDSGVREMLIYSARRSSQT